MIDGFEIGHHTADGDGWLTGSTVVVARAGAVGGVDVRGGGPGTRETDALHPTAMVDQVHAVVLSGGSAYGLAAADGVMAGLEAARIGFPVGPQPHQIVPIVPAAVIFDLGRGSEFGYRPTAEFGARALASASSAEPTRGCVGGGTGAQTRGLKGGFGYAQHRLADGRQVAAAVVVNAAGSPVDFSDGRLWSDRRRRLRTPTDAERAALMAAAERTEPSLATTLGVVMTDATLTKAQATKVAAVAHDGLARAVRPVHSMSDGDTIFCLASGRQPPPTDPRAGLVALNQLLTAAADVFSDACFDALVGATTRGSRQCYRDLAPSAFADQPPGPA